MDWERQEVEKLLSYLDSDTAAVEQHGARANEAISILAAGVLELVLDVSKSQKLLETIKCRRFKIYNQEVLDILEQDTDTETESHSTTALESDYAERT